MPTAVSVRLIGGIVVWFSRDAPKYVPRVAVNRAFRMSLDDQIAGNLLFVLILWRYGGHLWTSAEVAGKEGLVGRLGLEPRTKALKGPCSTN